MRYKSIDDIPQHLQIQVRKKFDLANRTAVSNANMEFASWRKQMEKARNKELDTLCRYRNNCRHGELSSAALQCMAEAKKRRQNKKTGRAKEYALHFHHVKSNQKDREGISLKACIDGLVYGGLLEDDSEDIVVQITETRERCKRLADKTIIEIWGV